MSLLNRIEKPLFVINCQANEHQAPKTWKRVKSGLDNYGIPYDSVFTTKRNESVDIIRKDRYHKDILSVSGDGGANAMIEGAMKNDYSEKRLGTIPAGTANDIARIFNIYSTPEKFYNILLRGETRETDVGEVNGKYFLGHASLGFDTLALNERNKRRFLKGKLAYFAAVFRTLFKYHSKNMNVKYTDVDMNKDIFMMVISNIKYYADGMKIAPSAKTDDGLLDLCLIEGKSNIESLFSNLLSVYNGTHINNPQIHYNQLKKLEISSPEPTFIQVDGDLIGKGDYFKFGIAERKLKFLC